MGGAEFISQVTQDEKRTTTLQIALQISINKVEESNPLLFGVLQYCAYLANENVPLDLLIKMSKTPEQKEDEIKEELKTVIRGKENYSLLTYNNVSESCYLHRTTQVVLRTLIPCSAQILRKIITVTLTMYPYDYYSIEKLKSCQKMESHFLALSQHITSDVLDSLFMEKLSLLLVLGQICFRFSRYSDGLTYLNNAWQMAQKFPDSYLEIQIDILRYLGSTKYNLGECNEGIRHFRCFDKALEKVEQFKKTRQTIEPYKLSLKQAQIHNEKGMILYKDSNTVDDALYQHRFARDICITCTVSSRESKLELALSYRGIGYCLKEKKKTHKALENWKKTLEIRKLYLGDNSPFTISICQSLGMLGLATDDEYFNDMGIDYSTSRKYVEQSLPILAEAYGSMSYDVAISYESISGILYVSGDTKDWNQALQKQDKAIEIYIKIFGE